jgi:hypothetical protein
MASGDMIYIPISWRVYYLNSLGGCSTGIIDESDL